MRAMSKSLDVHDYTYDNLRPSYGCSKKRTDHCIFIWRLCQTIMSFVQSLDHSPNFIHALFQVPSHTFYALSYLLSSVYRIALVL